MSHILNPPKFNSSPPENDGWKMILSYWVSETIQGRTVYLRGGNGKPHLDTLQAMNPCLLPAGIFESMIFFLPFRSLEGNLTYTNVTN